MNEVWKNYILPILDSWQWDNFSLVWDPFLEKYSKFSDKQRIQVEDALALTAFDTNDKKLAIKALAIAETLYTSHLATPRLYELIKNGLREQVHALKLHSETTYYYIVASSFFDVIEAIPFIKSIAEQIKKARADNKLNGNNIGRHSYEQWLDTCSAALLRLEPYYPSKEKQDAERALKKHHDGLLG